MISALTTTNKYILQPSLLNQHLKTLNWISTTALWQDELKAFQKILSSHASILNANEQKKNIDYFQALMMHYQTEVIDAIRGKLNSHEATLARMLELKNESDTRYFEEHDALMYELENFAQMFRSLRTELLDFVLHSLHEKS